MSIFPTRILLATDGSGDAQLAARSAIELAKTTGSELHVIYVVHRAEELRQPEGLGFGSVVSQEELKRTGQAMLDKLVKQIEDTGGSVGQAHLRQGRTDEKIVAQAEELGAGLIVVGSRGLGGVRRALVGSVSDSVVRHAHCPVMMVRGKPVSFPTKILLSTDGSEEAEFAARTAADLARDMNSELHVVHVGVQYFLVIHDYISPTQYQELKQERQGVLDEQVSKIEEAGGTVTKSYLRMGRREDEEIVALAEEVGAGLIAMGSRGLGGIRRALLGSVSDSVVRHAHCPVMVVRPEK
jgi:nucleotide-binding universal stress UspA family protein